MSRNARVIRDTGFGQKLPLGRLTVHKLWVLHLERETMLKHAQICHKSSKNNTFHSQPGRLGLGSCTSGILIKYTLS